MAVGGAQPHAPGGVQQSENGVLELDGQIPVARTEPKGEGAAGEPGPDLRLRQVTDGFDGGSGTAVQRDGGGKVLGLGPAQQGVHRGVEGGGQKGCPGTAAQMGGQVPAGQQEPAV